MLKHFYNRLKDFQRTLNNLSRLSPTLANPTLAKTKFGQTNFGQINHFWPNWPELVFFYCFEPISVVSNFFCFVHPFCFSCTPLFFLLIFSSFFCLFLFFFCLLFFFSFVLSWTPLPRTTLQEPHRPLPGPPNISLFFPLPPHFSFFLPSLGGPFVEVWWCLKSGTLKCARFRPRRFKHHQNSTRRPPRKEERKLWREREKKSAKYWARHPSGPHPSGPFFFLGSDASTLELPSLPSGPCLLRCPLPSGPREPPPTRTAPPPLPSSPTHPPTRPLKLKFGVGQTWFGRTWCGQTWFGQSWCWQNLVWPKLVLAKLSLAKVGVGHRWFGQTSQKSLAEVRLAKDGDAHLSRTKTFRKQCQTLYTTLNTLNYLEVTWKSTIHTWSIMKNNPQPSNTTHNNPKQPKTSKK